MNIETFGVLLVIAVLATIVSRTLAGYSLAGCLVTYILALFGGIGGWIAQQRFVGPDNLVTIPIPGDSAPVSVIGAIIGACLLAFLGGLLGRRTPARPGRSRR